MPDAPAPEDPALTPEPSEAKTFSQEEVNDLLAREKGKHQKRYADYEDVKAKAAKLDEIEHANRSEMERLTGERDGLKAKVPTLEQDNLRLRIAVEKGLVGEKAWIAERLRGDTEDELKADADQFLKRIAPTEKPPPIDVHGGHRLPAQPDEDAEIKAYMAQNFPQLSRDDTKI